LGRRGRAPGAPLAVARRRSSQDRAPACVCGAGMREPAHARGGSADRVALGPPPPGALRASALVRTGPRGRGFATGSPRGKPVYPEPAALRGVHAAVRSGARGRRADGDRPRRRRPDTHRALDRRVGRSPESALRRSAALVAARRARPDDARPNADRGRVGGIARAVTTKDDLVDVHPGRQLLSLGLAVAVILPGIYVRLAAPPLSHPIEALVYGLSIVGAAFLLSWAAEVAQLDMSAGLAIAILAFIAVLPEYAVDLVFAFKAGHAFRDFGLACRAPGATTESPCSLALANMTGANRLLIGIGWSLVVFVAWFRSRGAGRRFTEVTLERAH